MDRGTRIYTSILSTLIGVSVGLFAGQLALRIEVQEQRNSLVQQMCDYSKVDTRDTIRELCTKFQQQTETTYLVDTGNKSRIENK